MNFFMFRKFKMKNNGVTKEFYISQSGIKVSFIQVFWGKFIGLGQNHSRLKLGP